MPRNADRDQQVREKRMNQILDSALEVIAIKGIGAVSINDIARAAKVSVGNVYHYYTSKHEIINEILKRSQTRYGQLVMLTAALDMDAIGKLRLIATQWLSLSNHWAYTMLIHSTRLSESSTPEARSIVTERFTNNLQPVARIIEQGQREGMLIAGDPLELAYYFVTLIQGLTLQLVPGAEVQVPVRVDGLLSLLERRIEGNH